MSRSGYTHDCEGLNMWRGAVARGIQGKRGQQALRDLIQALDAMPENRLVSGSFSNSCGVCSLGAIAQFRGLATNDLEVEHGDEVDRDRVGQRLDISSAMAAEIMYENDCEYQSSTAEHRWSRMRQWAEQNLKD